VIALVDSGPIVALFDANDANHVRCRSVLENTAGPLVTCEAVIAEVCWLLRRFPQAQCDLLLDIADRHYIVESPLATRADHVARLMEKNADVPMSLADACLTDLAELHQTGRILTLDSDFTIYRWGRNKPFDLILDG
jgi:predicted nucleic acid-binding protein